MVLGRALSALLRRPGYACYAPSLRGHDASPGRQRQPWTRLQEYVDDVAETVAQLPAQPVLVHHPRPFVQANILLSLAPLVATPELVRDLLFCASTPDRQVNACQPRLQDESYRAFLDMLALDLVKTKHVNRIPMLVVGAEDDTIVSSRQIRRTAALYGTQAALFADMGHDMMLETGWRAVAEHMLGWLNENFPGSLPTRALRPE